MKSYVCGTSDRPLIYDTIGGAFDATVARYADRTAVIVAHQDVRWSWAQLAEAVDDAAAALVALGLAPGDRVGIWSPNTIEWVVIQFATARAGLVLVNINPAYRLSELDYALNRAGCRALVLADRFKSSDYVAMLRELAPELNDAPFGVLHARRLPELRIVIQLGDDAVPGMLRYADLASLATADARRLLSEQAEALEPDDPINIQFTSGTTGFPKGATLTHFNILNNGYFVAEAMGFTEADRLAIPVPLYHCFGMVMGVLGCMTHGATMVFPGEGFDAGDVLSAVETERCTALYGVPTMFIAILEHPDFADRDLSSLRTGVMAGAPCPVAVMKRVMGDMHMRDVTICYGMTETSPVSFQSGIDDPVDMRVATVGRVHPHVQVKIVDENGRVVPRGTSGELCTRGYSVMQGYWDDAERTGESIDRAGWMHTGDLAVLDEAGYCSIVGRVKDMIIRGGENIYPREIEEFLFRHPKIQDVSVFGVPDEQYGEQVAAWIRLKDGQHCSAGDIRDYCQGQIAHFKVPRYVRFVDEFPMTVTGKIQKFVMREQMAQDLTASDKAD